mmetsp:Transcript_11712/g.24528  ORF Transcript_11712/g.24528 Transcript_11712/m.24528 type:complete len:102 (+) Transcript_11712:208-513(+)
MMNGVSDSHDAQVYTGADSHVVSVSSYGPTMCMKPEGRFNSTNEEQAAGVPVATVGDVVAAGGGGADVGDRVGDEEVGGGAVGLRVTSAVATTTSVDVTLP